MKYSKVNLSKYLSKDKIPLFVCIGSKLSFYDNTSNRIGKYLEANGFNVIRNVDNINIIDKYEEIDKYSEEIYEHIAIDLSYDSKYEERNKQRAYKVEKYGIKPGSGIGRSHKTIGSVSIHITLNYFEDVRNGLDVILNITKQIGNKEIHKVEKEIVEKIKEFYKEV